mgnify:CR=1 FL=1
MPCMYNGQPVKGNKGSCPTNSSWVEDEFMAVNAIQAETKENSKAGGSGNFLTDWYNMKGMKVPEDGGAIGNVASLMKDYGQYLKSGIGGKVPQQFGKQPTPVSTTSPQGFMSPNAQRRETFDAGINPMTGKKLPGAMTKMQKLGANMKNPEWWSESISGLPSDTRLMRLGQLMNYYGKTPKGRQASDDPSKLWAANEAASAKIKATKDAAKAKSAVELYGKKTIADLTAELLPDVKEMFGDTLFGSFSSNPNANKTEEMNAIAGEVATNIKAISLAFPNKTPGEVRELALQQVMKDRGLDDLR